MFKRIESSCLVIAVKINVIPPNRYKHNITLKAQCDVAKSDFVELTQVQATILPKGPHLALDLNEWAS